MTDWDALRRGFLGVAAILVVALLAWWIETAAHDDRGFVLMLRCLVVEKAAVVTLPSDPIARTSRLGTVRTAIETNGVTISVSASADGAERIASAYRSVGGDLGARLELRGRNVFLWDRPPSPTQRQNLYECTY